MVRRLAAVLLLAAGSLASAQTTTGNSITISETNDTDRIINVAECKGTESDGISFNWVYSGFSTSVVSGTYRLTVSNTSGCPSTGTNQVFDNIPGNSANGAYPSTGTVNVPTLMTGVGLGACTPSQSAIYLCVDFIPSSGAAVTSAVTGSITLDLAKPPPPSITSVTPGDGALNVSWNSGSSTTDTGTATRYTVVATQQADATKTKSQDVSGATSLRVSGLENNQTYTVVVYGFTAGGNQSDPSAEATGAPVPVNDFWRLYHDVAQGKEQGGCSTGAAGAVALLVLIPLALRRRRRP